MEIAPCRASTELALSIGTWSWPATISVWVASFESLGAAFLVPAASELVNDGVFRAKAAVPMASRLPMARRWRLKARRDSTVISPGLIDFTVDHFGKWCLNFAAV